MDISLTGNVISVLVKKVKNSYETLLENVPSDKLDRLLSQCRSKFGCGGNVVKDATIPTIRLQGDQKFNIDKARDSIFEGMELRSKDKK